MGPCNPTTAKKKKKKPSLYPRNWGGKKTIKKENSRRFFKVLTRPCTNYNSTQPHPQPTIKHSPESPRKIPSLPETKDQNLSHFPWGSPAISSRNLPGMGIPADDVVLIQQGNSPHDPTIVTVNCPDKSGLGCDLCRIILEFGLHITRAGTNILCSCLSFSKFCPFLFVFGCYSRRLFLVNFPRIFGDSIWWKIGFFNDVRFSNGWKVVLHSIMGGSASTFKFA
jgi:hypothetical protein